MLVVLLSISIFSSCQEAIDKYSDFRAKFTYKPVSAAPNLYRACTSLGEFCSITVGAQRYLIKSPSAPSHTDEIPWTAIQGYNNFQLGLGGTGLIVGLPIIPEMLASESQVICFDLSCSNCHRDFHITKRLELKTGGSATCATCNRTYDLNNQGIISQGDNGRSLYRYYVHYEPSSQRLTINNN